MPYFRFTGLIRDWSAGSAGYRTHPSQSTGADPAYVSVHHSCSTSTFVADEERKAPYLRSPSQQLKVRSKVVPGNAYLTAADAMSPRSAARIKPT
jgi:hypothetical protein